jgi:protein farnesyltransferase subunit beta
LLDHKLTIEQQERAILTISECQHPEGGFGGGPKQLPHLACTFAAISALAIIGTTAAYETIHRQNLFKFLSKMKQPNGSFTVHEDGESDVRGSYCAIAVANLTNILTAELQNETANFLIKCQNYEGGFGAVPGAEAHAGYTYCALAALIILEGVKPESIESLDLHSLDRFAVLSQCEGAGGFRGRTNKLVDGCYSFWAGALFPMIRRLAPASYFDVAALQKYILVCCQNGVTGGLCDKPGK